MSVYVVKSEREQVDVKPYVWYTANKNDAVRFAKNISLERNCAAVVRNANTHELLYRIEAGQNKGERFGL